jgi:hypothetical protein
MPDDCELFVGCDKRSESNGWCAGAGNGQSPEPSSLPANLRAGTPRISFSPLVTPYRRTTHTLEVMPDDCEFS